MPYNKKKKKNPVTQLRFPEDLNPVKQKKNFSRMIEN
jgi:hypothetical protein